MPFPETDHIIYKKNPLIEVIVQLRFPPILSIESDLPAKFQNEIRNLYPLYRERVDRPVNIPDELVSQLPKDVINFFPQQGIKNYEFISEDEIWKVNLTRTFISMTTTKYSRWDDYLGHLMLVFNALRSSYTPSFFSRIGLRYKDLIDKSALNLKDVSWDNLLQPYIAGMLSNDAVKNNILVSKNINEIRLEDGTSIVRIRHSLVNSLDNNELCYLIDSDFFTEYKIAIDQAIDKLNYFNQRGRNLFRWCITDTLHNALEPENL